MNDGFYSKKDLVELTGLSAVTIWRLTKAGKFPEPVPLTPSGSRVGYPRAAVDGWCRERMAGDAFTT